jgi:inositol oxygenase
MNNANNFTPEQMNPLSSIEVWEDDVLERYPTPESTFKAKEEYRNYDNPVRDTVREFYKLNHTYQTYDFVREKQNDFCNSIVKK